MMKIWHLVEIMCLRSKHYGFFQNLHAFIQALYAQNTTVYGTRTAILRFLKKNRPTGLKTKMLKCVNMKRVAIRSSNNYVV